MTHAEPVDRTLGRPAGLLAAWLVSALINAVFIVFAVPLPQGGYALRASHHLIDAGQMLALGLATSALVELYQRFAPKRRFLPPILIFLAGFGLGYLALASDLDGVAVGLGLPFGVAFALLVAGAALLPVGAALAADFAAKRRWTAALAGLAGVAGLIANQLVVPGDYPGLHLLMAVTSAILLGGALSTLPLRRRFSPRASLVARAVGALVAAYTLVVWPGSAVIVEVFKVPGAVLAPFAARWIAASDGAKVVSFGDPDWFVSRTNFPAVAPSTPPLVPKDPVVIFFIVDCMRADLLLDPAHAQKLPNMRAMRDSGVFFSDARSPAPATTQSISSIFTSLYYSQLYWVLATVGKDPRVYPQEDTSPRFPELLQRASISTAVVTGLSGLKNEYGVVRGFDDEIIVSGSALSDVVVAKVLERIARSPAGPLFLYVHVADAHQPYDRATKKGTPFDRYLAEVGIVDKAIGQLRKGLKEGDLASRAVLMLSADHGEAFGEHNDTAHAHTVYDELLRVPLVIEGPGIAPRRVDTPVTLMDIGPTVLDLFQQPTPGTYMGQSLVPVLRGAEPSFQRPIAAESARRMQVMVFNDGVKVIRDVYRNTTEIYDLGADPKELENLFDERVGASEPHVAELGAFFDAHTLRRPGYKVPYQKL